MIDLSMCKPGQKLKSKHGMILTYVRPLNPANDYNHEIMYPNKSIGTRTNDGFVYMNPNKRIPEDEDIVEILPLDMNTLTFIEALNVIDDAFGLLVKSSPFFKCH
jgi:hypothetical protein